LHIEPVCTADEIYTSIDEGAVGGINIDPTCKPKSSPKLMSKRASLERYSSFPIEPVYQPLDSSSRSKEFTDYHSIGESRGRNGQFYTGHGNNSSNTYSSSVSNIAQRPRYINHYTVNAAFDADDIAPDYIHPM